MSVERFSLVLGLRYVFFEFFREGFAVSVVAKRKVSSVERAEESEQSCPKERIVLWFFGFEYIGSIFCEGNVWSLWFEFENVFLISVLLLFELTTC